MTLQQMEYIVAVDKYRHFVAAAEACNVTQSTLSSMIQKLESELSIAREIYRALQRGDTLTASDRCKMLQNLLDADAPA